MSKAHGVSGDVPRGVEQACFFVSFYLAEEKAHWFACVKKKLCLKPVNSSLHYNKPENKYIDPGRTEGWEGVTWALCDTINCGTS